MRFCENFLKETKIATEKQHRINREITTPEIRLIGADGEPIGVVKIAEALRLAEESELDLVEIAPTAAPPVCRIMDYGKFKYQEAKKAHEAKMKQKVMQVKEVKFRPGTDDGDYNVKLRNLVRFLEDGDKTKITLRFRGRELAHQEIGVRMLERLKADLEPYGQVEQFPKMEGRQMVTVFPGQTVTITDSAAYGMIVMQGRGTFGVWEIETPALIRYGQLTHDEYFVSESAAMEGVKIVNTSSTDPIVILKHFGPMNPDLSL